MLRLLSEVIEDDRSSCIGLLDISFIIDQIWSILISLWNCKRIKDRNCIYKTAKEKSNRPNLIEDDFTNFKLVHFVLQLNDNREQNQPAQGIARLMEMKGLSLLSTNLNP